MECNLLLPFGWGWNSKYHTPVVIGLHGCRKIEAGQRDLFSALWTETPNRPPDNCVITNLFLVLVAKHEHSRRNDGCGRLISRSRLAGAAVLVGTGTRSISCVGILVAILLFLAPHLLLFQTLPVHLIRHREIIVIVLVERVIIVPPIPEPGIVVAVAPPRKSEPSKASLAEAIVVEAKMPKMVVVSNAEASAKTIAKERSVGNAETRITETACRTGTHAAEMIAAEGAARADAETPAMDCAETCVARESAGVATSTETTTMAATTLRPERDSEEESERHDGNQAAHIPLSISPFFRNRPGIFCNGVNW